MKRFNVKMLECYRPIQGERWNCWVKKESGEREEAGKLGNFGVLVDNRVIAGDVAFSTTDLKIPLKEDADIKTGLENRLISIELEE